MENIQKELLVLLVAFHFEFKFLYYLQDVDRFLILYVTYTNIF